MDSSDTQDINKQSTIMFNKINNPSLDILKNHYELCKTNQPSDTASLHKEAGEAVDSTTKIQTQ